jgi:hypothetical protein
VLGVAAGVEVLDVFDPGGADCPKAGKPLSTRLRVRRRMDVFMVVTSLLS